MTTHQPYTINIDSYSGIFGGKACTNYTKLFHDLQRKLTETQPTQMKQYNTGVIVARFQTPKLHEGHRSLLAAALSECENVIVFLGVSVVQDSTKNPLDFKTRAMMIKNFNDGITVLPLMDSFSDEIWSKELDKKIREVSPLGSVRFFAGRDSFKEGYKGSHKVEYITVKGMLSGTDMRAAVAQSPKGTDDFRAGVIYGKANQWPKMHPTVDIAVYRDTEDGREILMGKKPGERDWRLIGGFMDPDLDETAEGAAKRECGEETGGNMEIDEPEYVCTMKIDDWRYRTERNKIMTTFFCAKYLFGPVVGSDDLAEVGWVKLKHIKDGTAKVTKGHTNLLTKLFTKWRI